MFARTHSIVILLVGLALCSDALAALETKGTFGFDLTAFHAVPEAWVPDVSASVSGQAVFSAAASSFPSGVLARVTFEYPGGAPAGVLTLDLLSPSTGQVYGVGDEPSVEWKYYEVMPDGVDFLADSADGVVEVDSYDTKGVDTMRILFAIRFEDRGPDGVIGTDDDRARELTEGFIVTSPPPSPGGSKLPSDQVTGASSDGTLAPGEPVDYGSSGGYGSSYGGGVGFSAGFEPESSGCGSGSDDSSSSDGGCRDHSSSDSGGGCGGDSTSGDSTSSGSSGCGDSGSSACEGDAEASVRSAGARGANPLRRVTGALPFVLILAGVLALRRRRSR